ncbi:transposase [bacterium]|nr:transposase [bacterium]
MVSRFAALRVRAAHRDYKKSELREREWLLVEWPKNEKEPTKYTLSSAPGMVPLDDLVRLVKLRWRIERDYEEMKQELGLGHYEGRGWRGFHHHGALCVAAYAFLVAERARLSPPEPLAFLKAARLPKGFRPRGAPGSSRTTQPRVHRHETT